MPATEVFTAAAGSSMPGSLMEPQHAGVHYKHEVPIHHDFLMCERKAEARDVALLDPTEASRVQKSWQYQATGKVACAAALEAVKAKHIAHG